MAYVPTNKTLSFPSGLTTVTLPARYRELGGGGGDAVVWNTSTTHTATVPRHPGLVEDIVVSDGRHNYRVLEVKEILSRYRLRLERI